MEFDNIDDVGGSSKIFFLDTNLNSPVLTTEFESTKNLITDSLASNSMSFFHNLPRRQQSAVSFFRKLIKVRKWSKKDLEEMERLEPNMYPILEQKMLLKNLSRDGSYAIAKDACLDIEEAIKEGLKARGLPSEEVEGVAESLMVPEADAYRSGYEQFSNLFGRAESRVKNHEYNWTYGVVGEAQFWINAHHALIKVDNQMFFSSLNQVLMLKDKLATRYMLLEHVIPLGLDRRLIGWLLDLFTWQDRCLRIYGNQAYNILKTVEPMFKTYLSHVVDNIFGNDTAYTRMITKSAEKEEKIRRVTGIQGYSLLNDLRNIVERVEGTRNIVEMFGCLKSCGHPIIDPILGGLSAAAEAMSPDETRLDDAQNLRNTFCHTILVSFIRKHGRWPRLVHMKPGTMLRKLNDRQERNIDYNSYPFDDWTTTEWTKFLTFDYFPNFLDLMDDKAISYYK